MKPITFILFFILSFSLLSCEEVAKKPPAKILDGVTLDFSRSTIDGYDAIEKALTEDTKKAGGKIDLSELRKPLPFKEHVIVYQVYKKNGTELVIEGSLQLAETESYQIPLDLILTAHQLTREQVNKEGQLYFHGFTYEKTVKDEPVYLMILHRN